MNFLSSNGNSSLAHRRIFWFTAGERYSNFCSARKGIVHVAQRKRVDFLRQIKPRAGRKDGSGKSRTRHDGGKEMRRNADARFLSLALTIPSVARIRKKTCSVLFFLIISFKSMEWARMHESRIQFSVRRSSGTRRGYRKHQLEKRLNGGSDGGSLFPPRSFDTNFPAVLTIRRINFVTSQMWR